MDTRAVEQAITALLKDRGIPADVAALIAEMKGEIIRLQVAVSTVGKLLVEVKPNPQI